MAKERGSPPVLVAAFLLVAQILCSHASAQNIQTVNGSLVLQVAGGTIRFDLIGFERECQKLD